MTDYLYWLGVALGSAAALCVFLALLLCIHRLAWRLVQEIVGWTVLAPLLTDYYTKKRKTEK